MRYIIVILSLISGLFAQNFTPIGDGYDCMTLANGDQFLVIRDNTTYTMINDKAVTKRLVKERKKINQKIKTLKDLSDSIKQKTPNQAALKIFKNIWKFTNGSTLDSSLIETKDERIQALKALTQALKDKKQYLNNMIGSINGCKEGRKSFPKGGILMYPTVQVVGLVGTKRQYSGWMIHDVALKTKYTTKPGGYNGCFKFYWKDGSTSTYMAGLGTEPCYVGSVNRFDQAVAACNAVLPKGRVGFAMQHGSSINMDQGTLDFLVASATTNKPGVVFLRKPDEGSYDKFYQACSAWNNN